MLTRGNTKLGRRGLLWGFGLPSVLTCPGLTPACSAHCYSARVANEVTLVGLGHSAVVHRGGEQVPEVFQRR